MAPSLAAPSRTPKAGKQGVVDCLGDVPGATAGRMGRKTAVLFRGERLSYAALAARVADLRSLLQAAGVAPGERVALALENCPDYIVSYFAVPAAGAALVPVNSFLAVPEIAAMLHDAQPTTLITSATWLDAHPGLLARIDGVGRLVLRGTARPRDVGERTIHVIGRGVPGRAAPACDPDSPAAILYTSGTTGIPKGVVLSHRNLLGNARGCLEAVGAKPRDRILVALPMFHSFTQMVGVLAPVLAGMSIALCERIDRSEVRTAIRRARPTIFPAVPAVFEALAGVDVSPLTRWLNPIRLYISGGSPLSQETRARFQRAWRRPLCEGYGLSEAAPVVSLNPPLGKPGSVGLPLPGVTCRIVDAAGREVAEGEPGALWVRGPGVMQGYLNRLQETQEVLVDGWLRTGDQARRDRDGYLYILGRDKEMLIFRGMNIYPREIEVVLESHPAVREAAVVGFPDPARGDVPWAFVTLAGEVPGGELGLKRLCAARLARYKVPRNFVILDDLPRNTTGKVLKTELRARFSPRAAGSRGARVDRARQH